MLTLIQQLNKLCQIYNKLFVSNHCRFHKMCLNVIINLSYLNSLETCFYDITPFWAELWLRVQNDFLITHILFSAWVHIYLHITWSRQVDTNIHSVHLTRSPPPRYNLGSTYFADDKRFEFGCCQSNHSV